MKETILIVDDEPDILSMLSDFFLYNGYSTMTAACGAEALKKAEMQPDLILLDINLPDMEGWKSVPGSELTYPVPSSFSLPEWRTAIRSWASAQALTITL